MAGIGAGAEVACKCKVQQLSHFLNYIMFSLQGAKKMKKYNIIILYILLKETCLLSKLNDEHDWSK